MFRKYAARPRRLARHMKGTPLYRGRSPVLFLFLAQPNDRRAAALEVGEVTVVRHQPRVAWIFAPEIPYGTRRKIAHDHRRKCFQAVQRLVTPSDRRQSEGPPV